MIKKGLFIIVIIITVFGMGINSMAQTNIKELAKEIVSNSLSIQALDLENQMKNIENKGEMIPDDPEISYAYLWGSPSFIGNRINIDATQRIKFPTYYAKKKTLNKLSSGLFDIQLELEINLVLYETLDILIDLTSLSEQKSLLTDRLTRIQQIFELVQQQLLEGEANRIEVEKAQLMVDMYKQDLLLIITEEKILHRSLIRLNSDKPVAIQKHEYSDFLTILGSGDREEALSGNPVLEIAKMNSQIADADIKLVKTGLLPDIFMGYVSEAMNDDKLAGVRMGISVPLWGKPNQIKRAKLKKDFSDKRLMLTSQIIQNDWDNHDVMAKQSLEIKNNLEASLSSMKAKYLLEESWHSGEISLLDYLKELPFFYSIEDRVKEAEKQYYKSILNKNKYHLQELILK